MMNYSYQEVAEVLVNRIVALGAEVILPLESPFDLFRVPGFFCDDLKPTLAQATFSLARAKEVLSCRREA